MEAQLQCNSPDVFGVLGRIKDSIANSEHVLILGKGDVELGSVGTTYSGSIQLGRAIACAMTQPDIRIPGDSARSISTTLENCILVYLLGRDLKVILVGPQDWNIALTTRIVDRVLSDLIEEFLEEWARSASSDTQTNDDNTPTALTQRTPLLPDDLELIGERIAAEVGIYSNREVLSRVLSGLEGI